MEATMQRVPSQTYLARRDATTPPQVVDPRIQKSFDKTSKSVFTRNTEKVATKQLKKVHHASDVPGMEMCQEILPGKRSTHGLSKWRYGRPESPLEKFHELLAHFGNSGMNPELSNILELGGTAEFNVKMR
jgi:hypothetical protein